MDCAHVRERLSEWIDGELAPSERQALDAHLAGCAPCRAERDGLVAVSRAIRALPSRDAPATLAREIRDRLARERLIGLPDRATARAAPAFPSWLRGAGLAAAAVLLVVLVGDFGNGPRRDISDDEAPRSVPPGKPGPETATRGQSPENAGNKNRIPAEGLSLDLDEASLEQGAAMGNAAPSDGREIEQDKKEKEAGFYRHAAAAGAKKPEEQPPSLPPGAVTDGFRRAELKEMSADTAGELLARDAAQDMEKEEDKKDVLSLSKSRAAPAAAGNIKGMGGAGAPPTSGAAPPMEIRLVLDAAGRRAEAIALIRARMSAILGRRQAALKKTEERAGWGGDADLSEERLKKDDSAAGEEPWNIEGEFTEEEIAALLADLARLGAVPVAAETRSRPGFAQAGKPRERGDGEGQSAAPRRLYRLVLE